MSQVAVMEQAAFSNRQMEIMRRTVAKDTSAEDFALFLEVCKHRQLDPFNREIYAIMRSNKMTIQVSIDGLRILAERSGRYRGQIGPYWCAEDGVWKEEWLSSKPPAAAKVGILRADFDRPIWAVARYESYVQLKDGAPTAMWKKMPDVMLAKCSEALALRKTFPGEMSGLYAHEEMQQADNASPLPTVSVSPSHAQSEAIDAEVIESAPPIEIRKPAPAPSASDSEPATEQQKAAIRKLSGTLQQGVPEDVDCMTFGSAKAVIAVLSEGVRNSRKAS